VEPPDDRAGYTKDEINRLGWYQPVYPDEEESRRAADRMAAIDDRLAEAAPGLRVTGAFRHGVGIPACIRSGTEAAAAVIHTA